MSNPSCYLCSNSNHLTRPGKVRDREDVFVLECQKCGLVFLDRHRHILEDHYQKSGMHEDEPNYDEWLIECKRDDERRIKFLKEKITNKSVLDFGCGVGGFLELAGEYSQSSYGLELETGLQEHFEQRNLKVFQTLDNLLDTGLRFDVITAFHVVEHLKDPAEILSNLSHLLNDGGEIIIEVPSPSDALLTLYNSEPFQNFTYWSQHLFLFNSDTLKTLSRKSGLITNWVKNIQRYPLSNHLYWLSQGKPGGHQKWQFLDSDEMHKAYESTLAALGLTDTIIGSLSKPEH